MSKRQILGWLLVVAAVITVVFFGLRGGDFFGTVMDALRGDRSDESPGPTGADAEQRAQALEGAPADETATGTGQPPASETTTADPTTTSRLAAGPERITEPGPDARRAERLLLALDSPLTPPVADLAERIGQARQERQERLDLQDLQDVRAGREASPTGMTAPAKVLHVLERGTVIPAVVQSAIDSDLPGLVRAHVSDNVYDSRTGAHVLIPRGARLIGVYGQAGNAGAGAAAGSRRLFVAWTDLRLPDGTPIDLGRAPALGPDGASGVRGRRTTGFWPALGAAMLFDLAGNVTAILTSQPPQAQPDGDLSTIIAAALGNAAPQVATDYIGTLLNQSPRFRIDAGSVMNVLIEQDLSLPAIPTGAGNP